MMQAMSARVSFKVSDEVREVLARSTITPTSVKLPDGQLERKLYESVNKVLAGAFHEDDVERAIFCQAARLIEAPK
jgi:hypothetical protein